MHRLRGRFDKLVSYRLQEDSRKFGVVELSLPQLFQPLGLSFDLAGRIQLDALVDSRALGEPARFALQPIGTLSDELREALHAQTGNWCKLMGKLDLPQPVYVFLLLPESCEACLKVSA